MKQVLTVVAVMLLLAMPCRAAGEPEQVEGAGRAVAGGGILRRGAGRDLSGGLSGLAEQALGQAGGAAAQRPDRAEAAGGGGVLRSGGGGVRRKAGRGLRRCRWQAPWR